MVPLKFVLLKKTVLPLLHCPTLLLQLFRGHDFKSKNAEIEVWGEIEVMGHNSSVMGPRTPLYV